MKDPGNEDVLENGMYENIKKEAINCRLHELKPHSELSDNHGVHFIVETLLNISSADKEANVRLAVKKILSQHGKEISCCVNCIKYFNQLKQERERPEWGFQP